MPNGHIIFGLFYIVLAVSFTFFHRTQPFIGMVSQK